MTELRIFHIQESFLSCNGQIKDVNDISVYEPAAELSFEGHQFCVPGKYTDYLLNQYGSTYMELPPEKDRQTHGTEPYWIGTKEEFDKIGL